MLSHFQELKSHFQNQNHNQRSSKLLSHLSQSQKKNLFHYSINQSKKLNQLSYLKTFSLLRELETANHSSWTMN